MEVLKPIFCVTRLIEIHITGLYQYLLMNVDANYDIVLQGFYPELNIIKGADMLNIKRQIFTFVETVIFKNPIPGDCILHSINSCIPEYKIEVVMYFFQC